MTAAEHRLQIAILAVPESSASTVYGMHDLLASAGVDWGMVMNGTPGPALIAPMIVTCDGAPVRVGNGLLRAARPILDAHGDAVGGQIDPLGAGVDQRLDALLLERLRHLGRGLVILQREDMRQHLDHGHFGAVRTEDIGELHADRPGAHHHDALRLTE